jgi:ATP-dependent protease ClpP protease subunit
MKWVSTVSPLIKEVELKKNPVIIRVNNFNEEAAKKFQNEVAAAHNTGQKIIPVVIDSYGGEVYSLMAMVSAIKNAELPVAGAAECDRLNTKIYTMMARNCGKKDDYFMKIVDKKKHADWFLDAQEAKKHDLANHLRVPKLTLSVNVEIELE